jgi:cytoskeletal protein RodZ
MYWFVSSTLVTHVQSHVVREINSYDIPNGVHASKGQPFLIMTWVAFALALASTGVWVVAAIVSWDYRKNRKSKGEKASSDPAPEQ